MTRPLNPYNESGDSLARNNYYIFDSGMMEGMRYQIREIKKLQVDIKEMAKMSFEKSEQINRMKTERKELKALILQFVSDYENHGDDFVTYGMIGMNIKQTNIENKELIEKLKVEE